MHRCPYCSEEIEEAVAAEGFCDLCGEEFEPEEAYVDSDDDSEEDAYVDEEDPDYDKKKKEW